MGASELLAQLANPAIVKTLPFADKMLASLLVTFLGMGITFIALIILQLVIDLLARFTVRTGQVPATEAAPPARPAPAAQPAPAAAPATAVATSPAATADDDEVVAVISAVLAMYPDRSAGGVVIRNVRRIEPAPAWGRAGIVDQMNSRF